MKCNLYNEGYDVIKTNILQQKKDNCCGTTKYHTKQNASRCQVQISTVCSVMRPSDIIVSSAFKRVRRITDMLRNETQVDTLSGRAYVTAVEIPSLFVS